MGKNKQLLIVGGVGSLILIFIFFIGIVAVFSGLIGNPFSNTIAVIPVYGEIAYSQSSDEYGTISNPDEIKYLIQTANDDPSVAAIMLDINSPGGSPVASEEIMEAVKNSDKPVVSWISDSGASGAYLVASGSDKIVASPSAWLGSIGVIVTITDLSDYYASQGIDIYSITGGKYKDMGADYRNLTPEERKMLQTMVDEEYDYFISLVAENRNLNKSYVSSIAEGKIYTGRQALNNKLVDYVGGKDYALDVTAELAGIPGSYEVVTYTPQTSTDLLSSMLSKLGYYMGLGIGSSSGNSSLPYVYQY